MKNKLGVYSAPRPHWVGDGFPVRSLFSYEHDGKQLSPFLLLDYAAPPSSYRPSTPRGVGEHPHRGFETVTIVYRGDWSTATPPAPRHHWPGRCAVDDSGGGASCTRSSTREPSRAAGGTLEMVQLWVNLPAADKMTAPGYQTCSRQTFPTGPAGRRRPPACDRRHL